MADKFGRGSDLDGPYPPNPVAQMAAALAGNPSAAAQYPTSADAAFANQQGFTYARPDSPCLEGQKYTQLPNNSPRELVDVYNKSTDPKARARLKSEDVTGDLAVMRNLADPQISDLYVRNALAAKRSALATLGWDPANSVLDFSPQELVRGNKRIAGFYVPPTGQTYVSAHDHEMNPEVMLHESVHRGIHKLQETGYWDPAWNELGTPLPKGSSERWPEGNAGPNNESVVRWLLQNRMGNPEGEDAVRSPQKRLAGNLFDNPTSAKRQQLEAMEAAASRYLKDKNPRGPR